MAHCITKGFVLMYHTEYDLHVPICDDWVKELYGWIALYINKIKEDLIDVGMWETSKSKWYAVG